MVFVFFDNESEIRDIPSSRQQFFSECRQNISAVDYDKVVEWINSKINDVIGNTPPGEKPIFNSGVLVSRKAFPPDGSWTPPMLSVYVAAGHDEERAKYFYGLICWKVVIGRDEHWLGYKDESKQLKGMTYFRDDPKSEDE